MLKETLILLKPILILIGCFSLPCIPVLLAYIFSKQKVKYLRYEERFENNVDTELYEGEHWYEKPKGHFHLY
jgi:hypothetical protein